MEHLFNNLYKHADQIKSKLNKSVEDSFGKETAEITMNLYTHVEENTILLILAFAAHSNKPTVLRTLVSVVSVGFITEYSTLGFAAR